METIYKLEYLVWLAKKNNSPFLERYRKMLFKELRIYSDNYQN